MGQPSTLGDPSLLGVGKGDGKVTLSWGGRRGRAEGIDCGGCGWESGTKLFC